MMAWSDFQFPFLGVNGFRKASCGLHFQHQSLKIPSGGRPINKTNRQTSVRFRSDIGNEHRRLPED